MTLTSAEVAKMQKHNADLVRENETLTRDNAELRRQVDAIKQAAIQEKLVCSICKHLLTQGNDCFDCKETKVAQNWQPPDA